jgi:hypothetical protein
MAKELKEAPLSVGDAIEQSIQRLAKRAHTIARALDAGLSPYRLMLTDDVPRADRRRFEAGLRQIGREIERSFSRWAETMAPPPETEPCPTCGGPKPVAKDVTAQPKVVTLLAASVPGALRLRS